MEEKNENWVKLLYSFDIALDYIFLLFPRIPIPAARSYSLIPRLQYTGAYFRS